MKKFKEIIFIMTMVVGLTFSVSAQKDDQKRPPKNPPVIEPRPKDRPPRGNPPKDEKPNDEKPKKPGMSFYLVPEKNKSDLA